MEHIQLFEAETRLSQIAEQVRRTGQSITLTQHGEPYVDWFHTKVLPLKSARSPWCWKRLSNCEAELPKSSFAQIQADLSEGRR